jgi:outer membrane protein TolC
MKTNKNKLRIKGLYLKADCDRLCEDQGKNMKIKYFLLRGARGMLASLLAFMLAAALPAAEKALSLEQAVQLALSRNERALAAGEQIRAAEGRVTQARAYFFPAISLTGNYTRRPNAVERDLNGQSITVQSLNALSGYAALSMILFDPYGIPAYRQASLENRAQRFSSAEAKRQLSFEVASAFLTTLTMDQVFEATGHRLDYAGKTLNAARARYAAGLVSVNDVTRAELEYATAEMGRTQTQGEVQTAYLELGYLLDTAIEDKLAAPELLLSQAEQPASSADDLLAGAETRRLDLRALVWHARAQHALVMEPGLKWLPSLSLSSQYRYTNEAGLTGKTTTWSAGLALNWSIFDGFLRFGQSKEYKALARLADLEVQGATRRLALEVRDSLVKLTSQQASLNKALVAMEAARRNAAETAELYRQGLSNALQVADANVSLFESEVEVARQRYGLAMALLNLRAAQGLDPFGKEPKL